MLTQQHCLLSALPGRSFVKSSGRRTRTHWKCTPVKSSWRKTGEKYGKQPKTRFSSWKCTFSMQVIYIFHVLKVLADGAQCWNLFNKSSRMQSTLYHANDFIFADSHDFFSVSSLLPFTVSQFLSGFLSVSPHRVKHHNILQLVDVFETRKEYFLFLEL